MIAASLRVPSGKKPANLAMVEDKTVYFVFQ